MSGPRHLIRLNGGPFPGSRVFPDSENEWPPPERLTHPEGEYRRTTYSAMGPTDPEVDHVIRGAEYDWHPDKAKDVE